MYTPYAGERGTYPSKKELIIPKLFLKSEGDIITASIRLSVHPSVRDAIPSLTSGPNSTKSGV